MQRQGFSCVLEPRRASSPVSGWATPSALPPAPLSYRQLVAASRLMPPALWSRMRLCT